MNPAAQIMSVIDFGRVDQDLIHYRDQSIGAVWELSARDPVLFDAGQLNAEGSWARSLLNALPVGWRLQIYGVIESEFSNKLPAQVDQSSLLAKLARDRHQRLLQLAKSAQLRRVRLYFVARSPATLSKGIFQNLWSSAGSKHEPPNPIHLQEIERIGKTLSEFGLSESRLDSTLIARLIHQIWNPGRPADYVRIGADGGIERLFQSDLVVGPNHLKLGSTEYRILSLKSLPERTSPSLATPMVNLPSGSHFFLDFVIEDPVKTRQRLERDRRIAFSMSAGSNRPRDIDSESKLEELDALLELMTQGLERVMQFSLTVMVRSDRSDDLVRLESEAASAMRAIGGAEVLYESLACMDIFAKSAFPAAKTTAREHNVTTTNLSDLVPIYFPVAGRAEPPVHLRNRMGGIYGFDPFSSQYSNYNQVVSGGSGAGKSFATNLLMFQLLSAGCRGYIIDIGGSYRNLCDLLGGQYIPLHLESNICINPFDLAAGEEVPSPGKLRFLLSMIESMTSESDGPRMGKLVQTELEDLLLRIYEDQSLLSISRLQQQLEGQDSAELSKLSRLLKSWMNPRPFGRLFDGATNVELQRPIVCFDLKGLESAPDLQRTALVIIADLIWRGLQSDRHTKKIIVMDECWRLLSDGAGAQFIGEIFRTCRKYHTSAIAISQALGDFYKSKVAEAILPNTEIKWLLRQKGFNADDLKEIVELNNTEVASIQNLRSRKGHFSEALLIAGNDRNIVRIESTPLEYWLATTSPSDLGYLDSQGYSTADPQTKISIITAAAEKYPHGIQENP